MQHGSSSAIFAADGSLIGYIRASTIRQPVPSRALPQDLKDATVAIEDKGFFDHGAIDSASIVRAAWKDLLGRRQAASGRLDDHPAAGPQPLHPEPRTRRSNEDHGSPPRLRIGGRPLEALDPDPVPEHRAVWHGGRETAVGAEAAAQTYYGEPAEELSLPKAALIAGLPQAPSEYNPFLHPKAALERRDEVLESMEEQGYISPPRYAQATAAGARAEPGPQYQ